MNSENHSGGGSNGVLVRLSLIKEIMKMPIWCVFYSVPNIHRDFGNCEWGCPKCSELFPICIQMVIKAKVDSYDKKPKNQRNFYISGLLAFK